MSQPSEPAVWFPTIRAGSGTDIFTERLAEGLRGRGLRAEITWLPHRAEYAPWTVAVPKVPAWANVAHVNSWLPRRFLPAGLPFSATVHHCFLDPSLTPYKSRTQALYHHFWGRKLEQTVLNRAGGIVAVSRYAAESATSVYGDHDIEVILNAIEMDGVFQPAERIQPHHPFRLLYVGNWSPLKGVDLLAPIMSALGPNFELRYTADRRGRHELAALPANAHVIGPFATPETVARAYRDADALLFPTRAEGLGLVALEAQACGLPVIATRATALPEVVADGETGLLCPQDDIPAFVAAARRLAGDQALWWRMRRAARAHVERQFDQRRMVDAYIAMFRRLVKA